MAFWFWVVLGVISTTLQLVLSRKNTPLAGLILPLISFCVLCFFLVWIDWKSSIDSLFWIAVYIPACVLFITLLTIQFARRFKQYRLQSSSRDNFHTTNDPKTVDATDIPKKTAGKLIIAFIAIATSIVLIVGVFANIPIIKANMLSNGPLSASTNNSPFIFNNFSSWNENTFDIRLSTVKRIYGLGEQIVINIEWSVGTSTHTTAVSYEDYTSYKGDKFIPTIIPRP